MELSDTMELSNTREFWDNFKSRSYADLFYIRTKIWRGRLNPLDPIEARWEALQQPNRFPGSMNMVYINIPFCATRCKFCIYYTRKYHRSTVERYLTALEKEAKLIGNTPYNKSTEYVSVYVGGGTPSILTIDQIERLAGIIKGAFKLSENVEISFEANPSSLSEEKVKCLKDNGFTRVSLGVQTFDDRLLRKMECAHRSGQVSQVIEWLTKYELCINVDMIYGLGGNDLDSILADFAIAAGFPGVQHITAFPLRLVYETPLLNNMSEERQVDIIEENRRLSEMCNRIEDYLDTKGFVQEEESTLYNRKGSREHIYRSLEGRILGLGAGAGSLLDTVESGNVFDPEEYIDSIENNKSCIFTDSVLSDQQNRERFILYRILFMNRQKEDFVKKIEDGYRRFFGEDINDQYQKVVDDLVKKRFIENDNGYLRITKKLQRILANFRFGTPSLI